MNKEFLYLQHGENENSSDFKVHTDIVTKARNYYPFFQKHIENDTHGIDDIEDKNIGTDFYSSTQI